MRITGGGSASLGGLLTVPMVTLEEVGSTLNTSKNTIVNQLDPNLQNLANSLAQGDPNAANFQGLAGISFHEAVNVHIDVTGYFSTAFGSVSKAANTLLTDMSNISMLYDGQLGNVQPIDYTSSGQGTVGNAAKQAFLALDPYTVLVTNVLDAANGNEVLQSGPANLLSLLSRAYQQLLASAASAPVNVTVPVASAQAAAQITSETASARALVTQYIDEMYQAVHGIYTNWGNGILHSFTSFQSAVHGAEQQLQPAVELLKNPDSAQSIFDLIHMISGQNAPIAITQLGGNTILVSISGTELNNLIFDTNIWNALGTGMGQSMPFEQDVINAIQEYIAEHGLKDPQVILAGHSLGGMVAQQVAASGLFNVTQVVTFGSPVMGPPVPGVKYDMYAAQWDPIPMLSKYEFPALPGSLQQVASMFPIPGGWPWTQVERAGKNASSADQVLNWTSYMYGHMQTPAEKLAYMDPTHAYGNSIQIVPDLTSHSPGVHSDYGQSTWLGQQNIFPIKNIPAGNFLSNTEYFGFSQQDLTSTAQTNQFMINQSSLGAGLLFYKLLGS